jgi:hypothetical protein
MKTQSQELQTVTGPLIGDPVAVTNTLQTLARNGELVSHSAPAVFPDGRCVVMTTTRAPIGPPAQRRIAWYQVVIAAIALALAVALVWAIVALAMWIVAHWMVVVGVLVATGFLCLWASGAFSGGRMISGTFVGRIH